MKIRGCAATVIARKLLLPEQEKLFANSFWINLLGIGGFFMGNIIKRNLKIILPISILIIALSAVFLLPKHSQSLPTTSVQVESSEISYKGESGKNALDLLLSNGHTYTKAKSGLVESIDGKKPDSGKKEYWAFYVGNKLAPVGPHEYKTHDNETIIWKIETY